MTNPHVQLPADTRWGLKAALRDLIKRAGSTRRAEAVTGVSDSHLSRCADPDNESLIGLPAVILLERDTGKPIVTEFLASLAGYRLVPIEPAPAVAPVPRAFAHTVGETGALLETGADSLADGDVTETEARAIAARARGARDAIDDLTHSVADRRLRCVPSRS